jgi:hypothetical protein
MRKVTYFGFISVLLLEENGLLSAIIFCWLGVKRNRLDDIWKQVMPYQLTNLENFHPKKR